METVPPTHAQHTRRHYSEATRNRLRRIEGQVRGVLGMMGNEVSCNDVVTQLSAIRAALDKLVVQVIATDVQDDLRQKLMQNEDVELLLREALERIAKTR